MLGLEVVRHYNSSLSGPGARPGALGRGWRLSYETSLEASASTIQVMQADGSILVFGRELLNPRLARNADPARGSIAVTGAKGDESYTWTWNDGRKLSFDRNGRLVQIQAPTGEILGLQHDARGLLVRVTDPQGRSLRLAWLDQDSARKGDRFRGVQAIETPVGRFSYGYGSAAPKGATPDPVALLSNLVSVGYPSAGAREGRRYHFEDARHPTLLTGISIEGKDGGGKPQVARYATYAYQGDGKAVMSSHAGGANKVTLAYAAPDQTIVTNSLGQKTVYRHATIANEYRLLEVRGAGCALCGEPNLRYSYDKRGRLTETIKLDDKGRPVAAPRIEPDYYGRPLKVGSSPFPHWCVEHRNLSASNVHRIIEVFQISLERRPQAVLRPARPAGADPGADRRNPQPATRRARPPGSTRTARLHHPAHIELLIFVKCFR